MPLGTSSYAASQGYVVGFFPQEWAAFLLDAVTS